MKGEDQQMFTQDPFLCTCGPCKKFYRENFGKNSDDLLTKSSISRVKETASLYRQEKLLKIGDRVLVWEKYRGEVKYVGLVNENELAPDVYVGVHLDDNIGSLHNGILNGKRYFHCPRGHGAMVRYGDVRECVPADRTPPICGNYMFPSWEEVKRKREQLNISAKQLAEYYDPPAKVTAVASNSKIGNSTKKGKRVIFDPHDMVVRDAQRREMDERRRRMMLAQQGRLSPKTRRLIQLRDDFGADDRADYMIQTLQKLQIAYEVGKDYRAEEVQRALQADSYDDDDFEDTSQEG